MTWEVNGTPDTLSVSGDQLEVADAVGRKFNQIISHVLDGGTAIAINLRLNANSNLVYAYSRSLDGGTWTEVQEVNQAQLSNAPTTAEKFVVISLVAVLGEEKLGLSVTINNNQDGSGFAPARAQHIFKFVPDPDLAVTNYQINNTFGGSYQADSNLTVLSND